MKECSKSIARRLSQPNFINHYFKGDGVDIGGKPDPLCLYTELFSTMESVRTWDIEDGDAQFMETVPDNTYDFVHSSHCLEHLLCPEEGLKNWLRIVKPDGYVIFTVPDEDLYEQGVFPSEFNKDHKWTFSIYKEESWSSKSINIIDLVKKIGVEAELVKIELLSANYRFSLPRFDQSITPVAECGIEIIIRKRTDEEIAQKGRFRKDNLQPEEEIRIHLNQYKDDIVNMKKGNCTQPPFCNKGCI